MAAVVSPGGVVPDAEPLPQLQLRTYSSTTRESTPRSANHDLSSTKAGAAAASGTVWPGSSSDQSNGGQGRYEQAWLRLGPTPRPRPSPPPATFVNAVMSRSGSLGAKSKPRLNSHASYSRDCDSSSESLDHEVPRGRESSSRPLGGVAISGAVAQQLSPLTPRRVLNGIAPSVSQSMVNRDGISPQQFPPCRSRTVNKRSSSVFQKLSTQTRESFEMRCCRINVLLVVMQMCLGATVTALGFYMETLTTSLSLRECAYWAGIPVSTHTL